MADATPTTPPPLPATAPASAAGLRGFEATRVYQNRATVSQVLADLPTLRTVGDALEARRKRFHTAAVVCGILIGLSFLTLVLTGFPGAILAVVLFIGLTIALGVYAGKLRKRCFDRRTYDFVEKVLRLVGTDVAPNGVVDLRLDPRAHNRVENAVRTGMVGAWKVQYFHSPWLDLKGRFMDGTTFNLRAVTRWQDRTKTKRNARGKVKTKHKTKQATRLLLRLWPKASRYAHLGEIPSSTGRGAVLLPPGAVCRRIKINPDSVELEVGMGDWDCRAPSGERDAAQSAKAPPPLPGAALPTVSGPHTAAMMFLSLYQILNLSRAMDRGAADGGE